MFKYVISSTTTHTTTPKLAHELTLGIVVLYALMHACKKRSDSLIGGHSEREFWGFFWNINRSVYGSIW